MKRFLTLFLSIFMVMGLLAACAPAPVTTTPPPAIQGTTPGPVSKTGWEQEWENTIAAAKKEGKVYLATTLAAHVYKGVAEAFKKKYGIEIEAVAGGTTAEVVAKLNAERRAGLYITDIIMLGMTTLIPLTEPGGALESMENVLILPEVRDANAWLDKKLPFYDKEGKILLYIGEAGPAVLINTDMVKPEEIKSWRSLLEPKWKGNLVLFDPTITGPGNAIIATVAEVMGTDFLKALSKQEPVMNRDKRLQVEWVAKGKYLAGIGFHPDVMEEIRAAGVPLLNIVPPEGGYIGSAVGSAALIQGRPNPNATKAFINWFLSKEGQSLFVKVYKGQSRRVDVEPDLPPDRMVKQGIKYIDFDSEYMVKKRIEMFNVSREVFAAQYK